MTDNYGRTIDYMRVSITDRCNLRCRYCMPEGIFWIPMEEILTLEEIVQICRQAAGMGIRKIKVTGGEPLVRRGCVDLVGMLKNIPGIEQVTLTTNGILLEKYAKELVENGLDGVNVSLDTLDAGRFRQITGFDQLGAVLRGIETMEQYPVRLKINTVLTRGKNDDEWQRIAKLAKNHRLDVRFIEMMPIGYGREFEPVSNDLLLEKLKAAYAGVVTDLAVHGNGPAVYYKIPGFQGSIGFISAIHGKFCHQCNRLRLTSVGQIKPCLCFEESISLKDAVRSGDMDEVDRRLRKAMAMKPEGHSFENQSMITELQEMSKIGG